MRSHLHEGYAYFMVAFGYNRPRTKNRSSGDSSGGYIHVSYGHPEDDPNLTRLLCQAKAVVKRVLCFESIHAHSWPGEDIYRYVRIPETVFTHSSEYTGLVLHSYIPHTQSLIQSYFDRDEEAKTLGIVVCSVSPANTTKNSAHPLTLPELFPIPQADQSTYIADQRAKCPD